VVLVVDRVTIERGYLGVFRFFPVNIIQPMRHTYISFIYHGRQINFFLPWCKNPPVGQGLLTIEDSRSHSDTPHLVRFLWTSDQPDAETSTWQHTTLTRDRHPFESPAGFEPTFPASKRPLGSAFI